MALGDVAGELRLPLRKGGSQGGDALFPFGQSSPHPDRVTPQLLCLRRRSLDKLRAVCVLTQR